MPYRILICPNAFKGSLTAPLASQAIAEGIHRAAHEGVGHNQASSSQQKASSAFPKVSVETICLPMADGGDGFLETLIAATNGELYTQTVRGPLGSPIKASWGRLGGEQADTAVIEMAHASGLRLLRPEQYDPRMATTFGTGELMQAALEAGCRTLLVGIGGSATNDGGAGMAQALGARLRDAEGDELPPGGAALARLAQIDISDFQLPAEAQVLVACDVDNPLCGPEGASAIYGPQKGATPEMIQALDAALVHYADCLRLQLGADVARVPGAGAAGGLGAGLMAFCHATLRSGTELALEVTDFEERLRRCDLVVTGEGRLDGQTARGKVVAGVARRAKAAGVPVVALTGGLEEGAEHKLRAEGLTVAFCITDQPMTVEAAMRDAARLLCDTAERMWRLLSLPAARTERDSA